MTTQYIANAKTYENLDLVSGTTNVVTVTDLSSADDQQATIDLGQNSFKFYDNVYTSLNIDSNGRITFGTSSSEYLNTDLTSSDANTPAIIAPFWTDLKTDSTASTAADLDDAVLYKIEGDRLIIEWNNIHLFDGGATTDGLTFQAILQLNTADANGKIVFNYPDLIEQDIAGNNGATATVGVKAPGNQTTSSFDRTLVSFNETNTLVGNSKAIEFTPTFVDPATPVITSAPTIDFAENGTGTVYTVTATAPQGATLTYGLSGTDANLFNIDINSGIVTFKTAPDFEIPTDSSANNIYDINIIANNGTLSNSQAVAITVTNVNEVVTNTKYIATSKIYENLDLVSGATDVVTVTDLSSTDDQQATIDLGQNSFKFYDTVYTSLNIDTNGRITFGTSSSDYSNTDLTSNDPNTPAIIAPFWTDLKTNSTASTEPSLDDSVLYKIEGDRLIIEWNNVHLYDGGATTDGLTFQAILQLNTAGANGKIVFNYPDLIEQDLAGNNGVTASVGVKASGSQTTSSFDRTLVSFNETNALVGNSKAIEFTPTFIDPATPVITSAPTIDFAENGTGTVYTVTATAPQGATLTYGLSGTDANLFDIDINSGVITFKTAPDFEIPTDSGANNIYDVNIIANNGTLSNSQAVTITVTNVNEVVTNIEYIATAKIYENLDLVSGATDVVTVPDLSSTDDQQATINLGQNSFKFYDTVYTSLNIDSNGRITFGTSSSDYRNTDLTSNDPNTPAIIAPFWTDLKTNSTASTEASLDDSVLYKIEGDRLIIEWNNVHFFDGGATTDGLTFQVILQLNTGDSNGKIVFNYPDLIEQDIAGNNGATATMGVKAPGNQTTSSFDRTLVSFNETNALVGNSKAIEFTPIAIGSTPIISLAVSADVVEDGVPNLVYTFTRIGDTTNALTVNYSVGGTATFNTDYSQTGADTFTASTGTVNFAANATTATVTVDPTADTTFESDETVILTLTSGTGYTIGTVDPVTGTIINDDPLTIVFGSATFAAIEDVNATTIAIPVTLSAVPTVDIVVPIIINASGTATATTDFAIANASITFLANTTTLTQNVNVTINPDNLPEAAETIVLNFGTLTGGAVAGAVDTATVTIAANDVITYAIASDLSIFDEKNSGTTKVTFTIDRTGGTDVASTIDYAIAGTATNVTDYNNIAGTSGANGISGTVSFGIGEKSKTITLDVLGDTVSEPDETIIANLLNPSASTPNSVISTSSATATIRNDDSVVPKLSKGNNDVFTIAGTGNLKLKVILTDSGSSFVDEVGAFTVDDDLGTIGGIAPGASGYSEAALARAKVIFSTIANKPVGFDIGGLPSLLEFASGTNLRFYLVKNSTTQEVLQSKSFSNVLFSSSSTLKIEDLGNDSFSLGWEDGSGSNDFKDLGIKILTSIDTSVLGASQQSNSQGGKVIDLRFVSGLDATTTFVRADFVVNREAAYNNFVGFYKVTDLNGGIDTNGDGLVDFTPGDTGYIQAAIKGRVVGIDLAVSNQGTAQMSDKTFEVNSIFAPFIIVNSTTDALLDNNTSNDPAVYFSYLGANTDGVDHIRMLGTNVFGFEDLAGGGDRDFNDIIIKASLTAIK